MNRIDRIIQEEIKRYLTEDGATTCGSVMQSGAGLSLVDQGASSKDGNNPNAGTYDKNALGSKVMRRSLPSEDDDVLNHKNMMKNSFKRRSH